MHLMAGTVDRPVGIDVSHPRRLVGGECPTGERIDGIIRAVVREDADVVRTPGGNGKNGYAFGIGSGAAEVGVAAQHPDFGVADGLAGGAVHQHIDDTALGRLGHQDGIGDHQEGVSAQFAAHRFHQVNALCGDAHGNGLAFPTAVALHGLYER